MSYEAIPGPPGLPILGNVADINPETPTVSMVNLTDIYGPYILILFNAMSGNICYAIYIYKVIMNL